MTTHRIVKLKVQNFKNLKAIEITPEGNVITLTGANGAGKSAVLDGMQNALAGKDGSVVKPIRDGAVAADIDIDLGHGLTAHRRHTAGGSTLTVKLQDERQSSPQAILDALTNGIVGFDPFAFTRLKPAEQRETFLKLVGLDFTDHDKMRQTVYTQRTDTNREVDRLTARLSACKSHPDAPATEQSASQLLKLIEAGKLTNEAKAKKAMEANNALGAWTANNDTIANALAQIAAWKKVIDDSLAKEPGLQLAANEAREAAEKAPETDIKALEDKLVTLELDNLKFRENSQYVTVKDSLGNLQAQSTIFSQSIEKLDAAKADAISKAGSPLEGLTFDDVGLLYEGRPLTEASTGHRIRVAVAIGMALKPSLRVIFVRDGSLLDEDGLKVIAEMAKENDFQVWIEDARSEDPAALVIEDGQLLVEHATV